MEKARIYLACPYSDPDPLIRLHRYVCASIATAELMKGGVLVFSPVTHSHYLAEQFDCPQDGEFWKEWYLSFLKHWATHLYVLQITGWEESKGVAIEMYYAKEHGIPIAMWE